MSGIDGSSSKQEMPYPCTRRVHEISDARGANVSAGNVFYLPYPLSYDTGYGMVLDVKYDGVSGSFTELGRIPSEGPDTTTSTWSRTIARGDTSPRLVAAVIEQRTLVYTPENAAIAFALVTNPISGISSASEGFDGAQDHVIAPWREHTNGHQGSVHRDFTGSTTGFNYLAGFNTILLPQVDNPTQFAYEIWRKKKFARKIDGSNSAVPGGWVLYRRSVDCTNRMMTLANATRGFPSSGMHGFKWCLFDKTTGARSPLSSEIYTSGKLGAKKR